MMQENLEALLLSALKEDIPSEDISTDLVMSADVQGNARIIGKETGIFYGRNILDTIFNCLDGTVTVQTEIQDGDPIQKNDCICELKGSLKTILKAERVLLNFLQRLCGVATQTRRFVTALDNPEIQVLDTRKTSPGLRALEKGAVLAGGGANHRFGLSDMILLKENHLSALEQQEKLSDLDALIVSFKKRNPGIKVEVEIETLAQLRTYGLMNVDYIMLDNFKLSDIEPAVQLCQDRGLNAEIEISGNITLDRITDYRDLPIQRISVGALTHSVTALDLSLRFH